MSWFRPWLRLSSLAVAAALFCPASSFAASAPASSYTMEEAVKAALANNPRVEGARQTVEVAESARKVARSGFGPVVSTSYGHTLNNMERPATRQERRAYVWTVAGSQPLFTGFNLLSTYQKAALQKESQELQLRNTELNIVALVQAQFLTYLKAQENINSTQRSLARARAQFSTAQAAFNVGLRPRLDVLQAEVDVTRAEAVLIQAENARDVTKVQLNTLLNLPVEAPVEYVGDLDAVPFDRTFEALLEQALRQRPDLLLANKSVEIARKDLNIAAGSFLPTVSATVAWNTTGNSWDVSGGKYSPKMYSAWQAGIMAQWNVFTSGRRVYATSQAKSQISALEAQALAVVNNSAYEVKAAMLAAQDAKRIIAVAERAVLGAQESYDNAKMRYQLQLGTNLDLLTAQSELASAELALTAAKTDHLTALSRLYIAIGEIHPGLQP